jgi:hypothetical protein
VPLPPYVSKVEVEAEVNATLSGRPWSAGAPLVPPISSAGLYQFMSSTMPYASENDVPDVAAVTKRERQAHRYGVIFNSIGITWLVLLIASVTGALITAFSPGGTFMPFVYALFGLLALALVPLGTLVAYVLDGGQ